MKKIPKVMAMKHWMMRKDGLQFLQIKKKTNKKLIVILMTNKAGLLLKITIGKWLKLILPTFKRKQNNNQERFSHHRINKSNLLINNSPSL